MFDIANLTPGERIINMKHPATGVDLGITATVVSIDDERMKALKRKIQNKANQLANRNKSFTAEEIEQNSYDIALAAMVGWDWGTNTFEGEVPQFTPANVVRVFKKLPWFHEQITNEISDKTAFFQ